MRGRLVAGIVTSSLLGSPAARAEFDSGVSAMFNTWSLSVPNAGSVVICHGFSCAFRTQIGLSAADQGRLAMLMAPGKASAEAERRAIAQAESWFEKRIAPETGTANAKARAGGIVGYTGQRGQFDCIDTTNNTNSLLVVMDRLGLLRHHTIIAPISRLLTGGGPHFTAVIKDKKTGKGWTVDPWTHDSGHLPDVWPVEKWSAGG
jgi:hypothetical protein